MSETKTINFEEVIQKEGSFIFVSIPFSPREVWGPKPRYKVTGTINGITVRGTLGVLGQAYFLRLSKVWMRESSLSLGSKVNVQLTLEDPLE